MGCSGRTAVWRSRPLLIRVPGVVLAAALHLLAYLLQVRGETRAKNKLVSGAERVWMFVWTYMGSCRTAEERERARGWVLSRVHGMAQA